MRRCVATAFLFVIPLLVSAQPQTPSVPGVATFPTDDPLIKNIWAEAMDSSRLEMLAHELLDVVGPRLVGTPQMKNAHDWAVKKYQGWGIPAKNEEYGKWKGWERGITHIDMLEPRVRTLEGTMMAWSPPSKKGGTTAGVMLLPEAKDSASFVKMVASIKGKFVMISAPEPTGRPDWEWEEYALKWSFDSLKAKRDRMRDDWERRVRATGYRADTLANILEQAGAVGVLASRWSRGWGVNKIFGTKAQRVPVVDLSVEDYNLLYRLVANGGKPIIRVTAESNFLGAVPTFNTIGRIEGKEKPNEYVLLSAHFDSWDAGSGATDNGTGSVLMMEAMRILKKYYPNPKRTILVGHWGSEEQGLNGSRAFVTDHPEVINGLQALFNQDNGTGRVINISASGYLNAGEYLSRWLSRIPNEVTEYITLSLPGIPGGGGTDHASFVAAGAPGFNLGSHRYDYFLYTWHTNRDTYDKINFDDVRNNVVLAACLAYLASEDPETVSRDKRVMPINRQTGEPGVWPRQRDGQRRGGLD
ncbi:MAG: M28 family peptidase [Bacteroidota bacterium]